MKKMLKPFMFALMAMTTSVQANEAAGGITVGGTRLIYDGSKKEASISVTNSDSNPYLIQSWAELQNNDVDNVPFVITPPLFRLEGKQQSLLRVIQSGETLPEDKESLYWLNIKSIPTSKKSDSGNTLQIAVKSRIKLIYRPKGLKGIPEDVTNKLVWSQTANDLTVKNPTPFLMNFQQVKIGGKKVDDATYVLPFSEATFKAPSNLKGQISWSLINDYGGTGPEHVQLH